MILDAKTLRVPESAPGLTDEKIRDSTSGAVNIARSLSVEQLARRLEVFVLGASNRALASMLGGTVAGGPLKTVPPESPPTR